MPSRALVAVVLLLPLAGCGSDPDEVPTAPDRKEETADELPNLERGHEEFVNADAGIAFGRPPGWSARSRGTTTTLTAPDELVSATITIDRTDEALQGTPERFASQTAEALDGYQKPLTPGKPKPFEHPYEGAVVDAEGVAAESKVRQEVRVVVLERNGVAVVSAVVAAHADREAATKELRQALGALRTLRTRPPA
jgi:hypothetical protein